VGSPGAPRRQSYATESLDAGDVHREVSAADRGPAANVESHEELAALERAIKELPHDLRTALAAICRRRPFTAGVRGASRRRREGGGD
jgi:hypothetical protein